MNENSQYDVDSLKDFLRKILHFSKPDIDKAIDKIFSD
jgi:hypothetical protein